MNTFIDSISKYKENIVANMDKIVITGDVPNIFFQCEKIPIDFAAMKSDSADGKVFTHPADFGWLELGNWQSLHEEL